MTTPPTPVPLSSSVRQLRPYLARVGLLALVWIGLNGSDMNSWIVGGPAVLAAAYVSKKLLPAVSWTCSLRGVLAFAGFFLRGSLRGGWDVAWRALSPGPRVSPALLRYMTNLPAGTARVFFCNALSLLPGTTVVAVEQRHIVVHVLDRSPAVESELCELEQHVAALFGRLPKKPGE